MRGLIIVQPAGWKVPRGYSNGVAGSGRVVMVGGQIGWDASGQFPEGFVAQVAQALRNVLAVVHEAGGGAEHIARLTWYVVDIEEYRSSLPALGAVYRETLGRWWSARPGWRSRRRRFCRRANRREVRLEIGIQTWLWTGLLDWAFRLGGRLFGDG